MSLFSVTPKNKLALIANIGTSAVEGILMNSKPDEAPEIIKMLRVEMPLAPEKDFQTLWRHANDALLELFRALKKNAPQKINLVAATFFSPWYISQTRIARLKRDSAFKVSKNLVEKIIDDEMGRFQNEIKSPAAKNNKEIIFIEKNIMKVLLNGYEVKEYLNKKISELELYIYASAIMKPTYDKFSSLVKHEIGHHPSLVFNTAPFAAFDTLRRVLNAEEGFLLVDIGGEITDVSLIKQGFVEQTASFVKGGRSIVRKLASAIGLPLPETASMIERHGTEELTANAHAQISESLFFAIKDWYNFFIEVLNNFASAAPLPQNVLLTGEMSKLKEIAQFISSEEAAKFTFLGRPFTVQKLLPQALEGRFHLKQSVGDYNYTSLIISSLFIDHYVWQKK